MAALLRSLVRVLEEIPAVRFRPGLTHSSMLQVATPSTPQEARNYMSDFGASDSDAGSQARVLNTGREAFTAFAFGGIVRSPRPKCEESHYVDLQQILEHHQLLEFGSSLSHLKGSIAGTIRRLRWTRTRSMNLLKERKHRDSVELMPGGLQFRSGGRRSGACEDHQKAQAARGRWVDKEPCARGRSPGKKDEDVKKDSKIFA